jgi:trigger factor
MDVKFANNKDNTVETLSVIIPYEEYSEKFTEILEKFRKLSIPGFRQGNAPLKVVLTQYFQRIQDDVISVILQPIVIKEIESRKSITKPAVKKLTFGLDVVLEAEVTYDLYPDFELPDFSKIQIFIPEEKFDEEYVERAINEIRQKSAFTNEAPPDHLLTVGDIVTFSYRLWFKDKNVDLKKDELGDHNCEIVESERRQFDFIREFLASFAVGRKKDDVYEVPYHMPKEHKNRMIANQDVVYKVTIKNAYIKELPEFNDDLVASLGYNVNTTDQLREMLTEIEKARASSVNMGRVSRQLPLQVAEMLKDVKIPDLSYTTEILRCCDESELPREALVSPEYLQSDDPKIRSKINAIYRDARANIIMEFVAAKIVEMEKLTVTDDEAREYLQDYCEKHSYNFESLHSAYLKEEVTRDNVKKTILREKAVTHILSKVVVKFITKEEYYKLVEEFNREKLKQDEAERGNENELEPRDERHEHSHPHAMGDAH